jgi:hypothetical protein
MTVGNSLVASFQGVLIANALLERLQAAIHSSGRVTGYPEDTPKRCNVRVGDDPGAISFCLNLELHARIAK